MAAASIFGANLEILTYQQGYFDPGVKKNALLHLWSLGVEEQFYIIWPFAITLVVNRFAKKGFWLMVGFTVISFVLSIICVYQSAKFAFYFPFCRFWQMSVGGLIAYSKVKLKLKVINNLLSFFAVFSIFTTVWYINEDSLFPGFWALIPTLSATFIIIASN